MKSMKRILIGAAVAGGLVFANYAPPVWGSILGEENLTLVQILAEIIHAKEELQDINDAAHTGVELTRDLLETYQAANAGIDELRNYTWDKFVGDFKEDLYHQYPGLGELEYASRNLQRWENTRTRNPWTAYEAISAVAGDVSAPLREDIRAGRVNVDEELILHSEAAGGFTAAYTAEEATRNFDDDVKDLHTAYERDPSPGSASMINARATLLVAAQNSHIIRLLSRSVRLDGVDKALSYGARMRAKNSMHERRDATRSFTEAALEPPRMMRFDTDWGL